jgi:hypothetical protein
MARFSFFALTVIAGCSSSTTGVIGNTPDGSTSSDGNAPASSPDAGNPGPSGNDASSPVDSAVPLTEGGADAASDAQSAADAGTDAGVCMPPQGATCPTTAGNCKGIGNPCTKGGGECTSIGKSCDKDLDPTGQGICISYLACTPGQHDCGTGASCCKTAMTQNVAVCLPNQCIVSDCTPEP